MCREKFVVGNFAREFIPLSVHVSFVCLLHFREWFNSVCRCLFVETIPEEIRMYAIHITRAIPFGLYRRCRRHERKKAKPHHPKMPPTILQQMNCFNLFLVFDILNSACCCERVVILVKMICSLRYIASHHT